jgi:hypothetical protein
MGISLEFSVLFIVIFHFSAAFLCIRAFIMVMAVGNRETPESSERG